ncbi:uncharacterized protein si:ch211-214p13.7 isoform X2 [Sebastes umbrosus]|uniref:uncharacterized protein LOC141782545 n=1 Tax=Sebastes fasciatus TaxID=394691 RepID=UPI00189D9556|nr:uncharacterized protein si:ch211-214p13.7 isoform X1 [Sebastes umbrosus]XP_037646314.1 uncharacterized protein si:ch211-214p13.7 isoform X2 [Sebastes umbrosus]
MGNCTSGIKKKRKGDPEPHGKCSTDNKPSEDVTYASIDHSSTKGSSRTKPTTEDDCDYAIVYVPAALQPETVSVSSKDECADDYVLMG